MAQVRFHPHALERMAERGATEAEVMAAIQGGEELPAKFGRTCYRRNFVFGKIWRGRLYRHKQLEVFGEKQGIEFLVLTVIVKYF